MTAGAKPGERRGGKQKGYKAPHTLDVQEARRNLIAKYLAKQDPIDSKLIEMAIEGDMAAIKEVYSRVYGSVPQGIDMTVSEKLKIADDQFKQLLGTATARASGD